MINDILQTIIGSFIGCILAHQVILWEARKAYEKAFEKYIKEKARLDDKERGAS